MCEKLSKSDKPSHNVTLMASEFIASYLEPEEGGAKGYLERLFGQLQVLFNTETTDLKIDWSFTEETVEETTEE